MKELEARLYARYNGARVLLWMKDETASSFLVIFTEDGSIKLVDRSEVTIDPAQFIDLKKLLERETGCAPGALDLE